MDGSRRTSRSHGGGRPSYKEESGSDDNKDDEEGSDEDEKEMYQEEPKAKTQKSRDETPRKKKSAPAEVPAAEDPQKRRLKRLERKITASGGEKLSTEELMETNTFQRFTRLVENIFDATEDVDLSGNPNQDDDADVPQEAMIPKQQLHDLCAEAAKLKVLFF